MDYLPVSFKESEIDDIKSICKFNPSFYETIFSSNKRNLTNGIFKEIEDIKNSKIARNFVLNVRGLVGSKSGVFKSAFSNQIALSLDPSFNVKERVSFTLDDIDGLIAQYGKRKEDGKIQVFE